MAGIPPKPDIGPGPAEPDPWRTPERCDRDRLQPEFFVLAINYSDQSIGHCTPWPDPVPPLWYLRMFQLLNPRECLEAEPAHPPGYLPNETTLATVATCGPDSSHIHGRVCLRRPQQSNVEYVNLPRRYHDTWMYYRAVMDTSASGCH